MNLQFWAIGRDHENYVSTGVNDFTKRVSNYFPVSWKIIPAPKNAGVLTPSDFKRKEAEQILKSLSDHDYLVSLDERGKMLSSVQFADFFTQRANESTRSLIFLIGGAYGIDEVVLKRSHLVLSFSLFTFPHQLVRLILCEQVYRACTIMKNEKYHHS